MCRYQSAAATADSDCGGRRSANDSEHTGRGQSDDWTGNQSAAGHKPAKCWESG